MHHHRRRWFPRGFLPVAASLVLIAAGATWPLIVWPHRPFGQVVAGVWLLSIGFAGLANRAWRTRRRP